MKHFISLMMFAALCICANAQRVNGSLEELAQAGRARLEVDYSEALIHGMTEDEFSKYEEDWYKDKDDVVSKFEENFAEEIEDYIICNRYIKSPFVIVAKVVTINRKGDTVLDLLIQEEFEDGMRETLAAINYIKGDGGTFGSKINLIGDGAKSTGENAGKFLKKEIKRILKSR